MIAAPTDVLIERMERRTTYLLAGLPEPDTTIRKFNVNGPATVVEQAPLPSGREFLAHLITQGRSLNDPAVQVAREAAIAELLTSKEAEEGS